MTEREIWLRYTAEKNALLQQEIDTGKELTCSEYDAAIREICDRLKI